MKDRMELLVQALDQLLRSKEQVILAIDGNCTAGKTTLAGLLASQYDCNVFHMDDFFLRPEQRTAERYGEIGGNVDYERFLTEVLEPLKAGQSFSYRPFDCKTFSLKPPVTAIPKGMNIIEGTYSMHPYFADPYDLKIFLSVDAQLQKQRIQQRPEHLRRMFFEKWIPMEQAYFTGMQIGEKCDFRFSAR